MQHDYRLKVSEGTLVRRAISGDLFLCKEHVKIDIELAREFRQCASDKANDYDQLDFFCFALVFLDLTILEPENAVVLPLLDMPEIGTLAYTAQVMSLLMPDEDWDQWKDDMKDRDL